MLRWINPLLDSIFLKTVINVTLNKPLKLIKNIYCSRFRVEDFIHFAEPA